MRKCTEKVGFRSAAIATAFVTLASCLSAPTHAAQESADYASQRGVGRAADARRRAVSKFKYMFGAPARWPGAMHWSYNHANAPAQLSGAKDAVIQQSITQSSKWSAACGIQFVYDGETAAVPKTLAGGPDGISVVGWQKPDMGVSGATYSWWQSNNSGAMTLVDSDMMIDPNYVTTTAQLTTTVVHEWGHAIGLAHSNVERTLMSGPPDSSYTNYTDLSPDDVHGCRCLYGPPAGQTAGNVCSLPEVLDFGKLSVGTTSSESAVTVTNNGNAALDRLRHHDGDWRVRDRQQQLSAGASLAPGASCSFGVAARPSSAGDRSDEATINTSEGPYRIPLDATGVASRATTVAGAPNYEGSWWAAPAGVESGWGLNFAHQGDVIFVTWFTYDATGKTWWLSMTANKIGKQRVFGHAVRNARTAFNSVPFNSNAVTYSPVGNGTLTFSDANNGTFAYSVNGIAQSKPITRTVFGNLPVCTSATQTALTTATNYQDIWWAGTGGESGWGIHVTQQGQRDLRDLVYV
jgi:hypothetical protein